MLSHGRPVIGGVLYMALVFLHPGQQAALRRYELDAVRRDPEMATLSPLRREIVRKALLLRVDDVPLERYFKPG